MNTVQGQGCLVDKPVDTVDIEIGLSTGVIWFSDIYMNRGMGRDGRHSGGNTCDHNGCTVQVVATGIVVPYKYLPLPPSMCPLSHHRPIPRLTS